MSEQKGNDNLMMKRKVVRRRSTISQCRYYIHRRERERRAATNAFIYGQQLSVCCPTELPSSIIGTIDWSAGGGEANIAKPSDDESLK